MSRHGVNDGSRYGRPTKSRLAVIALLAVGALMASTGAALGASALSTDTNSSAVQYGAPGANQVLGGGSQGPEKAPGANQVLSGSQGPEKAPGASQALNAGAQTAAAQAPRQAAVSQQELPFTGYAPIPILLIGLAMLAWGLVLRRRTASPSARA